MKQLFLIIGAPGSGKTTDAQAIAKRNTDKVVHYSTGDLLREEVASGSDQGKLIGSIIAKGELVPLDIVVQTIIGALANAPRDIVLIDGYPRSIEQMQTLHTKLAEQTEVELVKVIEVSVSEQVAKDRVLGRARGADDDVEVFNNRMRVFLEPLAEIRAFYGARDLLHTINGERTIEEIVEEMNAYVISQVKG